MKNLSFAANPKRTPSRHGMFPMKLVMRTLSNADSRSNSFLGRQSVYVRVNLVVM